MAATDPQSLFAYGKCFQCHGASAAEVMIIALLDQILEASSGSDAVTMNFSGVGSPEGVQTAPVGSVYTDLTDTDNPGFWLKTTGSGNTGWAEVITDGP